MWESDTLKRKGQFNGLVPVGELQRVRRGNVNELLRPRVTNLNVKGDGAKTLDKPCVDNKVFLNVRKCTGFDGIEDSDKVGLSTWVRDGTVH